MEFSLKRSKDAPAAPTVPAWHPNFRNYARLPDTKVVRTAFFVNGLAVLVTAALLLVVVFREYTLASVRGQIEVWNVQIEQDRRPSGEAVALFRKYQAEEKIINEVDAFLRSPLALSDFLLRLGATLPENIALTGFDYRETGITLRATVRGAPERASGLATSFVEQLRTDERYGPLFSEVIPTGVNRDPSTGRLLIEVLLRFKTEEGARK